VHALRHVHTLIVPGGTLVDIHPVTEEELESRGKRIAVIPEPEWIEIDLPNSEAALLQTIAEGLFELEAETEYEVLEHFDHSDELIEAKRKVLESQPLLVEAIRAARVPLRTRTQVVFRRLRALPAARP
jgi:hypothetical protein